MSYDLVFIIIAAFFAGLVDAVVGGGGFITIPALFSTFPNTSPALLLGSNKINAFFGTSYATWSLTRKVKLVWRNLIPGVTTALIGSFTGAWIATITPADLFRKLLPIVLLAMLIYTIAKKDLGQTHNPNLTKNKEQLIIAIIGLVIGFYDGFLGPGTGTFFIFLLVRLVHYDFLNASATAKVLNLATNLAAIVLFGLKGYIWWQLALTMAVANVGGSFVGTKLMLKHGTYFVRIFFIVIVSLLILKTGYDAYFVA